MSFITAIRQCLSNAVKSKPWSPHKNSLLQGRQYSNLLVGEELSSPRSPKRNNKVMVVTGATSHMSPALMAKGLEKDYRVVACARDVDKVQANTPSHPMVTWVKTPKADVQSWNALLDEHVEDGSELVLFNTIGAATASPGKKLADVNEKPVMVATDALLKQGSRLARAAIGHFSTIAVSYLPQDAERVKGMHPQALEYCQGRQRVDQALMNSGVPTTIVRPGFVFSDLRQGKIIDTGHAYSPEQLATLPFHPVMGRAEQPQQPVYDGDVIECLFNGVEQDAVHLVDAVGPEILTQADMFRFFVELKGGKFRPVSIPYDFAEVIAHHFPKGRIAPYAISMFKLMEEQRSGALSPSKFEELVGRPLVKMSDVYRQSQGETLVFARPPIGEHMKEIMQSVMKNPEARHDMMRMVKKYGWQMCIRMLQAYFSQ